MNSITDDRPVCCMTCRRRVSAFVVRERSGATHYACRVCADTMRNLARCTGAYAGADYTPIVVHPR